MAADADAPEGEMSRAETEEQLSIQSEEPASSSPDDQAPTDRVEDDESAAGDTDDGKAVHDDGDDGGDAKPARRRASISPVRLAMVVGLVATLALGGVVGWLGFKTYQLHQEQEQRELFLRVGRQGAVNLTTIDWQNVNNDIQRILDSATGSFYDDFSKRSQPFIDVVKKVQSKSVGTVTEAGLESVSRNEAQVLVAVSVKTSNLGAEDQPPRAWRMRIDVQKVGDGAKVSNVLFVPS
ncbi:Mce protein [Mycobacterium sp.]|uniref:Mce protein n=1 Tax=Mycobacterium sp. TaxID=1785 RepID=UPI003F9CF8C5